MSAISHFWASVDDIVNLPNSRLKQAIYRALISAYSIGAKKDFTSIKDIPLSAVDKLAWELEVIAAELK